MPQALEQEIGHGNAGLLPWDAFVDVNETVPELTGQAAFKTYNAMRTDAQIASLLLASRLVSRSSRRRGAAPPGRWYCHQANHRTAVSSAGRVSRATVW
jgi:hypothetical protein